MLLSLLEKKQNKKNNNNNNKIQQNKYLYILHYDEEVMMTLEGLIQELNLGLWHTTQVS